jgi:hypothetical protein
MAGAITTLHQFQNDVGPEPLSLLDTNFGLLSAAANALATYSNYYVDSGSTNALVITLAAGQTATLTDGLQVEIKVAATTNSTTPTLNAFSLGAKTITNADGTALAPGQLAAGTYIQLQYNATASTWCLVGGGVPRILGMPDGSALQLVDTNPSTGVGIVGLQAGSGSVYMSLGWGTAYGGIAATDVNLAAPNGALYLGQGVSNPRVFRVSGDSLAGFGPTAAAFVDMTPDSGSFTITGTGFTANPTGTAFWRRIGPVVIINLPALSGTSNATTFTLTGIPAAIQASSAQNSPIINNVNNGVLINSVIGFGTSSTWTLSTAVVGSGFNSSGWANAGTKGLSACTVTYVLA